MTFERLDVVVLPFPYTARPTRKRRPAVVLTGSADYGEPTGQAMMAMITRARNPAGRLVRIDRLGN